MEIEARFVQTRNKIGVANVITAPRYEEHIKIPGMKFVLEVPGYLPEYDQNKNNHV